MMLTFQVLVQIVMTCNSAIDNKHCDKPYLSMGHAIRELFDVRWGEVGHMVNACSQWCICMNDTEEDTWHELTGKREEQIRIAHA